MINISRGNTHYTIPEKLVTIDGAEYFVSERIAQGGNAVVHECLNIDGDLFAVKFQIELKDQRRARFGREVALLKAFRHQHIIEYINDGTVLGTVFTRGNKKFKPSSTLKTIDIPFVILSKASKNLTEFVKETHFIPSSLYFGQFLGLADALAEINVKAIHRDIKPENILIVGPNWALSDFGLCDVYNKNVTLTADAERIGPVFWMSPEAINDHLGQGDAITEQSDVFQLASVFWFVVCKRHPTGLINKADWKGDKRLFPILEQALQHSCDRRFDSSAKFLAALEAAIRPAEN
jgi:eukaryotic-like serine/threonine-protein kinase